MWWEKALSKVEGYVSEFIMPEAAKLDAYHIACATIFNLDYLLTWNCAHIANAVMKKQIEKINRSFGFETPVICTPEELLEV